MVNHFVQHSFGERSATHQLITKLMKDSMHKSKYVCSIQGEKKGTREGKAEGGTKERRGKEEGGLKERRGKAEGGTKERRGKAEGGMKERRGKAEGGMKERRGKEEGGTKERRGKAEGGTKERRGKAEGGERKGEEREGRGRREKRRREFVLQLLPIAELTKDSRLRNATPSVRYPGSIQGVFRKHRGSKNFHPA